MYRPRTQCSPCRTVLCLSQIPTHLILITTLRSTYGSCLQLTNDLNSHAANLPERVSQTLWPISVVTWSTRSMQQGLLKSLTLHLHHCPSSWETKGQPSTPRCPLGILIQASIMWSDHLSYHIFILWGAEEEITKLQTAQHQVMWKGTDKNPVTQSIY